MAITLLQSVASRTAQMETSCLRNASRVALYGDSKYEMTGLQDSFNVLLEPNGMCLYSCVFFCQCRLFCRHAMKAMLATISPAIVHSVAARRLVRLIPQRPPHGLQAAGETKKIRSLSHRRYLPLFNAVTLGSFSKKGCSRPFFVQLRHL